jgi:hypothetical protein
MRALREAGAEHRIPVEDLPEITISTHNLNRALLVDLQRSRELGGGTLEFEVPWRYVLLENFGVFHNVELAPYCWTEWRDLCFWSVRYQRNGLVELDAMQRAFAVVDPSIGWCLWTWADVVS